MALALVALAPATATGATVPPVPSAAVSSGTVSYGASVTVTGRLTAGEGLPGAQVRLQSDSYPFRGFTTIATVVTAPDGTYAFTGVRPNRNTRLRVLGPVGDAPSASLYVVVNPAGQVTARDAGRGQAALALAVRHTGYGATGPVRAYWYVAADGSGDYRLQAVSQTRESAHLTTSTAIVNPPADRFSYRVCFSPSWRHAMGTSGSYRPCVTDSGLTLAGTGDTRAAPAFPGAAAVSAAGSFLDGRVGSTAYAVVDDTGRLSGVRIHERFETASVVKVMMLVSYLEMLAGEHRGIDAASNAILYPMIHISDNNAASAVFAAIGGYPALERIAAQSQMTDFAPGVGWWAYTQTSAADQARFFFELDGLIPAQFDAYARALLSGIEPSQSWGVPPVARPDWEVFFKTGALPSQGLFHEAALLERPGVRFSLCVLTNGDPSMGYGEESIAGVGSALISG